MFASQVRERDPVKLPHICEIALTSRRVPLW